MGKANRRFHGADLFGIRIFRWAAALSGLILLAHCTGFAQSPARHPAGIQPAPAFNRLFDRSYGGWTGGDGTLSIPLPDGRSVWLFGDTFLGRVTDDGKRSMDTPLVRNCLVVQDGRSLKTLLGSDGGKKRAFFRPGGKVAWYWPGDGSIEEGRLAIFLHRFEQQYPGMWGWRWTGNALATVSLPDLTLEKIDPLVSENGVLYGVSVLEAASYTYIYGTGIAATHPQFAHLARAPTGRLNGSWSYYNGRSWTANPAESAPVLSGVSTQYSVIAINGAFYLFTMDARIPFGDTLVVYRATSPQGPWQGPQPLFRPPETTRDIVAYNPFVHTQFRSTNRILVSYNLNHIGDPFAVYQNADIYRPRFVWVNLDMIQTKFLSQPPDR